MRIRSAMFAILLLSACGGDGGGGGGSVPVATTPAITSAASVTVPENVTGTVYQATATDPRGAAITFRIEGDDAARFAITTAGALSFTAPPDYENPTDGNRDNVYDLTLVASNGAAEARSALRVTVSNVADAPTPRAISGFLNARYVAAIPGSGSVFVSETGGRIYRTDPSQAGPGQLYLTVGNLATRQNIPGVDDGALISIAAAPDYASSGVLYAMVVSDAGNLEVRRYGRLANGLGDGASADVILRVPNVETQSSSLGGGIAFGPDNYLYLGIGNGQLYGRSPGTRAQDLTSLQGKILRIDVRSDAYPADPNRDYAIPATNPFQTGGRAPEIYAYGLENPRRMAFDGTNLLIGEAHAAAATIADQQLQEVDLLRPQDAGANFGFPAAGGAGIAPPVIYTTGTLNHLGEMTGGFVYRGPVTPYVGSYFLADARTGEIWTVPAASIMQGTSLNEGQLTPRNGLIPSQQALVTVVSFGTDANGNLYVVPSSGSDIYIVELR